MSRLVCLCSFIVFYIFQLVLDWRLPMQIPSKSILSGSLSPQILTF